MELQQRRNQQRGVRQPGAFLTDSEHSEDQMMIGGGRGGRGVDADDYSDGAGNAGDDLGNVNDYGENKENLAQWIKKPEVTNFIRKKFGGFLRSYQEEGIHVYEVRI